MAEYSAEELELLASTPAMIGAVTAAVDKSGVMGIMKEAVASARAGTDGLTDYPNNSLIKQATGRTGDAEADAASAERLKARALERLKSQHGSIDELRAELLESVANVVALIDEKADATEAAEYKTWALSVGHKVAEAAKEGGFMGIGGEQVSEDETGLLNQVQTALGL